MYIINQKQRTEPGTVLLSRGNNRRNRGSYRLIAITFGLIVILLLTMAACAAGPNELVNTPYREEKPAGFLNGLWHGFIALFTFIISLFNSKVNIYEVHNNGGWYNFGFILGVMIFFSSGGGAGRAAYKRNKQ